MRKSLLPTTAMLPFYTTVTALQSLTDLLLHEARPEQINACVNTDKPENIIKKVTALSESAIKEARMLHLNPTPQFHLQVAERWKQLVYLSDLVYAYQNSKLPCAVLYQPVQTSVLKVYEVFEELFADYYPEDYKIADVFLQVRRRELRKQTQKLLNACQPAYLPQVKQMLYPVEQIIIRSRNGNNTSARLTYAECLLKHLLLWHHHKGNALQLHEIAIAVNLNCNRYYDFLLLIYKDYLARCQDDYERLNLLREWELLHLETCSQTNHPPGITAGYRPEKTSFAEKVTCWLQTQRQMLEKKPIPGQSPLLKTGINNDIAFFSWSIKIDVLARYYSTDVISDVIKTLGQVLVFPTTPEPSLEYMIAKSNGTSISRELKKRLEDRHYHALKIIHQIPVKEDKKKDPKK